MGCEDTSDCDDCGDEFGGSADYVNADYEWWWMFSEGKSERIGLDFIL
jgi:hypothetical protein